MTERIRYGTVTGGTYTLATGKRSTPSLPYNAPIEVVTREHDKLLKLAAGDQHEIRAERLEREASLWRNRLRARSLGLLEQASAHRDRAAQCWAEAES